MILVYVIFIGLMGKKSSNEYNRSFEIETQLDEQKKVLEHINKIDGLTKIYNRGYFNIEFQNRWDKACLLNNNESVILIDIDRFKTFNDAHGHLCGDACLIHVTKVISGLIRSKIDLFARFGGEEFVILLSDCSLDEAALVAEKMRSAVEMTPFEYDGKTLSVTASFGVAVITPNLKTEKEVPLIAADDAMYAAKNAGRNKVMVSQEILT